MKITAPARINRCGLIVCCLVFGGIVISTQSASAQLTLDWWTVDGGGGYSSAGGLEVRASAGQPDAGSLSGGTFDLEGGFWYTNHPGAVPVELMSFEIASTSSERPRQIATSRKAAPLCRSREPKPSPSEHRSQSTSDGRETVVSATSP